MIPGTDPTQVEGFDEKMLPDILSITGTDMSRRPSVGHFTGRLNLSLRRWKTGGKYTGNQTRLTVNPAVQALRMSAQSPGAGSKGPLGILYRSLPATKGSKSAVKAVARKPGILFYTLVNRSSYDPKIASERIQIQTTREIRRLHKIARKLGCEVKKIAYLPLSKLLDYHRACCSTPSASADFRIRAFSVLSRPPTHETEKRRKT
jgi:hypothetical protein